MEKFFFITIISGFCVLVPALPPNNCVNLLVDRNIHDKAGWVDVKYCERLIKELKKMNGPATYEENLRNVTCQTREYLGKICCPHDWMISPYGPLRDPDCGIPKVLYRKIYGGTLTPHGQYPWTALLGFRGIGINEKKPWWGCSGSLISTGHVLTTAHCILGGNGSPFLVRLGDHVMQQYERDKNTFQIKQTIWHPNYNRTTSVHDIALIFLTKEVTFTRLIKPLCLPVPKDMFRANFVGQEVTVAGYGYYDSSSGGSSYLRHTQLPVLETSLCVDRFKNATFPVYADKIICAGDLTGKRDTCHGDSGGSLIVKEGEAFYSIGLVSYGGGCGKVNVPAIYTRTASYLTWILSHLF